MEAILIPVKRFDEAKQVRECVVVLDPASRRCEHRDANGPMRQVIQHRSRDLAVFGRAFERVPITRLGFPLGAF